MNAKRTKKLEELEDAAMRERIRRREDPTPEERIEDLDQRICGIERLLHLNGY